MLQNGIQILDLIPDGGTLHRKAAPDSFGRPAAVPSLILRRYFIRIRPPKECATTTGGAGNMAMRSSMSLAWESSVPATI